MPFPAQVFRILIASPNDVGREREAAADAIQRWNDMNSSDREVVLLPVRWETHAAPEYAGPQAVINRQVGDIADILVGIFWTRLGSPTGVAESGTLEEIRRAADAKKPVMLYFSQAPQRPDLIDTDQLTKLRAFKTDLRDKALFVEFADTTNFSDVFARQLDITVKNLLAESQSGTEAKSDQLSGTVIDLQFADPKDGKPIGDRLALQLRRFIFDDFEAIPDFSPPTPPPSQSAGALGNLSVAAPSPTALAGGLLSLTPSRTPGLISGAMALQPPSANKDYLRQEAALLSIRSALSALRFYLKNNGSVGARDVHVDVTFSATSGNGKLWLKPTLEIPTIEPQKFHASFHTLLTSPYSGRPEEFLKESDVWQYQFDVRALQPQRQVSPASELTVGAPGTCEIKVSARIYADTLPSPISKDLLINLTVTEHHIAASEASSLLDVLS